MFTTRRKQFVLLLLFLAYLALVTKVIVFKGIHLRTRFLVLQLDPTYGGPPNFVPFRTIWPYLRGDKHWPIAFLNLVGNIAPFVPLGLLAPSIYRRATLRSALALGVAVGVLMESLEAIFHVGVVDIDDVLLNASGVLLGYALWRLPFRWRWAAIATGSALLALPLVGLKFGRPQGMPGKGGPPLSASTSHTS